MLVKWLCGRYAQVRSGELPRSVVSLTLALMAYRKWHVETECPGWSSTWHHAAPMAPATPHRRLVANLVRTIRHADICIPHRCIVIALTAPAMRHLRKSVPTRPCFVNPGFGTATRHTSPGRLGLMRRNRQSQRFSPALGAFLARQNRRARRSSIAFPPQGVRRARPAPDRNHQGRDGRGLATQEIHHG